MFPANNDVSKGIIRVPHNVYLKKLHGCWGWIIYIFHETFQDLSFPLLPYPKQSQNTTTNI
jgi:hypothetical protein